MTAVILFQEEKTILLLYGISPGALKASLIISLLFTMFNCGYEWSLDLNK